MIPFILSREQTKVNFGKIKIITAIVSLVCNKKQL